MVTVVEQILLDAQKRGIEFPTWHSLRVPVRFSNVESRFFSNADTEPDSLLKTVLRSIFVETVDWETTWERIVQPLSTKLEHGSDDQVSFRIVGMGPNSRSLTHAVRGTPLHPRLAIIDHFPEHEEGAPPEAVAIVGLSVNYPSGKGQEQFWSTLENRFCAVSEVIRNIPTPCRSRYIQTSGAKDQADQRLLPDPNLAI
jgi:hypothetical protein